MANGEDDFHWLSEKIEQETSTVKLVKHLNPLNEESRKLHGSHDLDQVVQHHAVISFEHVQADILLLENDPYKGGPAQLQLVYLLLMHVTS